MRREGVVVVVLRYRTLASRFGEIGGPATDADVYKLSTLPRLVRCCPHSTQPFLPHSLHGCGCPLRMDSFHLPWTSCVGSFGRMLADSGECGIMVIETSQDVLPPEITFYKV